MKQGNKIVRHWALRSSVERETAQIDR